MKLTDSVNVFHGSGNIDLPAPKGIAASWHFIKAICGNTHPGALLPFGKYSVCPYSTGYSSGFGTNALNTHEQPRQIMDHLRLKGFSHFQNSGTGGIKVYYNYAVVTPFFGEKADFYDVCDMAAEPGYFRTALGEEKILCELTADTCAAMHRYTFPRAGGKIAVDFANDGLYDHPSVRGTAENLSVTQTDDHTLCASVTLQGVRLHFVCRFFGRGALDAQNIFCLDTDGTVILSVSVSAASSEDAMREAAFVRADFDAVRTAASAAWEDALSSITIETEDAAERELFYSNLYQSLIKPCDWGKGGFLWDGAPFVADFSTLWDMYKTALPMIFTLFPTLSAHIVEMYKELFAHLDTFPNCFMLARNFNLESKQSRLITVHLLYDAWIRGTDADWPTIFRAIYGVLMSDDNADFRADGACERTTHTLDMAENCAAAAEMADALGFVEEAAELRALAGRWRLVFDTEGLLLDGREYYEGNRWNYSFRPMHEMAERIAICGTEKFEAHLDRFFGFAHAEDTSARFEGFNNETDMESPYAYAYIGRHDKLCAILSAADRYMFRDKNGIAGPGAIPGNNDSGGLSSCWIWNTLGIFPVSGQNLMHIVRPKFEKATLRLASGKTLTIERRGTGDYPRAAEINGSACGLAIPVTRVMQGGTLTVIC